MRIILVEDDWLFEQSIREAVQDAFPNASIESICTELEFHQSLGRLIDKSPDLIILDIMLRWTDPGPEMDISPLVASFQLAGLRCRQLLHRYCPHIPIILHSILTSEDIREQGLSLRSNERFIIKEGSPIQLFQAIEDLLSKKS
jgi:DNA-binding NarL/FixJ family response regulator